MYVSLRTFKLPCFIRMTRRKFVDCDNVLRDIPHVAAIVATLPSRSRSLAMCPYVFLTSRSKCDFFSDACPRWCAKFIIRFPSCIFCLVARGVVALSDGATDCLPEWMQNPLLWNPGNPTDIGPG